MSANDMWEVKQAKEYIDKLARKIDELQNKLDTQSGKLKSYPKVQYKLGQWHNRLLQEHFDKFGFEKTKEILDKELVDDRTTHAEQVEIFQHNSMVINGLITMCTNAGLKTKEKYYKTTRSSQLSERNTEWYISLLSQRGTAHGGDFEQWYRNLIEKLKKFQSDKLQSEKQQEERKKLLEKAREIGFDGAEYIEDNAKLKQALKEKEQDSHEICFNRMLNDAPYYVLASFFGHCLRGSWAEGRRSYGCSELTSLEIPEQDNENPELWELSLELQRMAEKWDGEDGRYFRGTYSTLDELLNETDAEILNKMNEYYYEIEFGC